MMTPALSAYRGLISHHKECDGATFKVDKDTILATPCLALTHNHSRHDLLFQSGLSFLYGGHDHITDTGGGQTIKTALDALDGDDVQVLGTRVIGAVDDGTNGQTKGHAETVTGNSSTS